MAAQAASQAPEPMQSSSAVLPPKGPAPAPAAFPFIAAPILGAAVPASGTGGAPDLAEPAAAPAAPVQAPMGMPPMTAPASGVVPGGAAAAPQPSPAAGPVLEALRGGWAQQWALPLQISDYADPLFAAYLASVRLSPEQAASLAQPRPPTAPDFGAPAAHAGAISSFLRHPECRRDGEGLHALLRTPAPCVRVSASQQACMHAKGLHAAMGAGRPVALVALDEDMDTCLVGWSSAASCRAKGLNETLCALMPVFSDVATAQWGCPHKNETQVLPWLLPCAACYCQSCRL